MSFWDSIFGGGQSDAYSDLAKKIQQGIDARKQYTNQAIGYEQPYMDAGTGALNSYSNYLSKLGQSVDNPSAWMDQYQESPYAKFQTDEMLKAANQAAAASGMLGSGDNQEEDMKLAQQISSGDMQNYFNNMMSQRGLYQQGLNNLSGMGLNASTNSGNWAYGTGAGIDSDYGAMGKALGNADMGDAEALNNGLGFASMLFGGFL